MARTPIGWTEAGGAVLIETHDDIACEEKRRLEIWRIGSSQPAGCYDLFDDPDKRTDCAYLSIRTNGKQPGTSTKVARFPRAPTQLDPSKVRVRRRLANEIVRVTVDVDVNGTWRRAWTGDIEPNDSPPTATLWPNPRGDRALLLLHYWAEGNNNETIDVHWVDLR